MQPLNRKGERLFYFNITNEWATIAFLLNSVIFNIVISPTLNFFY